MTDRWKGNMVLGRRPVALLDEHSETQIIEHIAAAEKRIADLEGDLQVSQLKVQRIDEVLVGSYGDIPRLSAGDARRMLRNIAHIVKPPF